MLNNKKLALMTVLLIFLVGCSRGASDEKINLSEMIENGKVEIAGNSYDLHYNSVISYKYDGDNVVERLQDSQKNVYYYDDENMLSRQEVYSDDRLLVTIYYTYDSNGKEIRQESVIEQTKDKTYKTTSYDKNYKEVSYYDKNDELSLVAEVELNDKQQMIKFSSKSKDGILKSETYFEYEDNNKTFEQLTTDHGVIRESYFKYNEYGDQVSVMTISFSNKNMLNAMYYDNEYDGLKLVKQTAYEVSEEIDENETRDIVKSLK